MQPILIFTRLIGAGSGRRMRKAMRRLGRWGGNLLWPIRATIAERRARWREGRLFNAACRRPAWQSSTYGRERVYGARRATSGQPGGPGHSLTRIEDRPWWIVELQADWPIHSIRIRGRRGRIGFKITSLQVSLSPDGERWQVIHHGHYLLGDTASHGLLVIRLLDTCAARFVKLELTEGGELALNQVEVMVAHGHKALLRVSERYGFVFNLMTSSRMRRRVIPFSVRNVAKDFDGRIEAFHINAGRGRFGNRIKQIGTAVCLARRLGIARVYVMKVPMMEFDRPIKFRGVTILPDSELGRDKPKGVLRGTFYFSEPFGAAFDRLDYRDIAEAARAAGQPAFRRLTPPPAATPSESDLVIHFRAGDIFSMRRPNGGYAQPPLAFYRLCVDFARAHLGARRVILVYEDDGNPCVGALKAWLEEIACPYVSQSRTLEEDLAVLLAARHCVFGRGTFGPAVAILSDTLRTIFHYWTEPSFAVMPEVSGVRLVVVSDAANAYIPADGWRNTADQKQMMLDYPIENLRLKAD
jgi:hypothetical protein